MTTIRALASSLTPASRGTRANRPDTLRRRSIVAALATAVVLAVSACASSSPEASAAPTPVALPDTVVGQKAQWVLDTVNAGDAVTEPEITANIAPVMLEQVPASQLVTIFGQLGDAKPWIATSVTEATGGLTVLLHSSSAELQMQIAVDEKQLINGLLFQQPPADRTPAASWKELKKNVAALDAGTSMTVTPRCRFGACGGFDRCRRRTHRRYQRGRDQAPRLDLQALRSGGRGRRGGGGNALVGRQSDRLR